MCFHQCCSAGSSLYLCIMLAAGNGLCRGLQLPVCNLYIYQVTCIACVYLPEGLLCKHGYSCVQGVLPTVATMLSVFRLPGLQVPFWVCIGPHCGMSFGLFALAPLWGWTRGCLH